MTANNALLQFRQLKYGLFIHFGLYSLFGGVWQGKETPGLAEWIQNDLDIPPGVYAQLAEHFNPTAFDAREIARKAKAWGMRYLCFTAKHHDGFALFDSQVSDFNSITASPCRRDFVHELAEACHEEGLMFCLYYSQAQDWHHGGYRAYHPEDAPAFARYFETICLPQVRELLTQYGDIGMMWFDTPMGMTVEQSRKLVDLVKSLQTDCLINGRIGHGLGDYLTMADNRIPRSLLQRAWEVPVTLNHSWGYKVTDDHWVKSPETLKKLLKVISRGGNMLLNIGPRGDGSIPEDSEGILDDIGRYLSVVAEAFYATQPAQPYVFEAEDMYFTQKPGVLYIHLLKPENWAGKTLSLYHIASRAKAVNLLASQESLRFRVGKDLEGFGHWAIELPASLPEESHLAWVIKVALEEENFTVEALE